MLLAVDIGNSHTVVGLFDGKRLIVERRFPTAEVTSADDAGRFLRSCLSDHSIASSSVTGMGISSVVPSATIFYESASNGLFLARPVVISARLDLGIRIHYADPLAVGADRLCNAVAGYAKFGGPLIIVDFGTATTYDVVGANGDYLGGVIAPGVETSAADLHRRTAQLPRVELHFPSSLIGIDTVSSMQAGILYGAIDAMEGMIGRLKSVLEKREGTAPHVIGTGGFSSFISKHSRALEHAEPSLVLEGVRLICERVGSLKQ
ncbi:MAG: hypothetical protein A2X67_00880 [Ignavibacteria bacterium GWA2_55_11]|nr:MAG: hypothetical protein A2X67_00880 [Ignavibacteria bacterium GWA2_55_11]OGU72000.1 MAG: hypothetical protein A3G43_02985 [Ignavibacteria bacterium RIFCSPLOWO2_12_FULL_56_21]HAV24000.1 type III pantothenate kinase [Bacteroidota bacterium]